MVDPRIPKYRAAALAMKRRQFAVEVPTGTPDEVGQLGQALVDLGQGIPAEELPKVFTEFGKTSTRPTAGEKSTGLVLAIVKRMVEAHYGSIRVESQVGIGSTFTFALPLGGNA